MRKSPTFVGNFVGSFVELLGDLSDFSTKFATKFPTKFPAEAKMRTAGGSLARSLPTSSSWALEAEPDLVRARRDDALKVGLLTARLRWLGPPLSAAPFPIRPG